MQIAQPTPELPVPDVLEAQAYYRDRFGFTVEWFNEPGGLGAVSHGECAIFFRKTSNQGHPGTFWIFAEDIDASFSELEQRGAEIVDPISDKPWGMRQFTVQDAYGNQFHFHHDL